MIALRTALMVMPGLALAMTLLCGSASEVDAATSAWVGDGHAAVRLITAVDVVSPATPIEAGLEFRYAPGWHGYWRTPGDTGVPPVIDWSGTEGLAAATVSWPAPHRLVIDRLQNSVYEGRVVLPLRRSRAPRRGAAHGAPIDMQAEVDYAACSNVCVPFHADLALSLATGAIKASGEAPDIAAARAAVPRPPRDAGIAVVEQSVSGSGADRKLVLSLRSDTVAVEHPDVIV